MRGGSSIKKRENVRDNSVVFLGSDNIPEAKIEVIIVSLGLFLVSLRSLDSGKCFGCLGSGRFGLLLTTTLGCGAFITFEIIETV